MAFDFPSSPTEGQEFTPPGGPTYVWNAPSWKSKATTSLYVAKAGDTMSGNLIVKKSNPILALDKNAAGDASYLLGQKGGLNRWGVLLGDGIAEGGSNAGSNFVIVRYDDTGAPIDNPLTLMRNNGVSTFGGNLTIFKANPTLSLSKTAANQDNVIYGQNNGLARWSLALGNSTAETGTGNAGSDFGLNRFNDAGAYLDSPLFMQRNSDRMQLPKGQLQFPATINQSTDPNTLDDYRELSWVPDLKFNNVNTGITYTNRIGNYVKIGGFVWLMCRITLSSKGAAVGNATITGLPWYAANSWGNASIGHAGAFASLSGAVTLLPENNYIVMNMWGAAGIAPVTNANFTNTTDFIFGATYQSQ